MPRRCRAAPPVDSIEVSRAREAPAARSGTRHDLGREVLAAAPAAALENGAARARTHALAEAVLLCALALIGLVGALHVSSSVSAGRERGSVAVARQGSRCGRACDAACGEPRAPRRRGARRNLGSGGGVAPPVLRARSLWTTLWISQECPQRAAFRCRRRAAASSSDALASAPLAPSARRRSTPACAVDERSHARRRSLPT